MSIVWMAVKNISPFLDWTSKTLLLPRRVQDAVHPSSVSSHLVPKPHPPEPDCPIRVCNLTRSAPGTLPSPELLATKIFTQILFSGATLHVMYAPLFSLNALTKAPPFPMLTQPSAR